MNENLVKFLQKEYVESKHGSPTIEEALRDCLTDIIHLSCKLNIPINKLFESASKRHVKEVEERKRFDV
jgi:hypothetical protein